MVLQGRLEYVGLDCIADRRTYLDRYLDENCIGPASFSYHLPVLDQKTRGCCAKAWRFTHGVPEITHKRATARHHPSRSKTNKVKGPQKRKPLISKGKYQANRRERIFISWLSHYASDLGSKLPFMGNSTKHSVIRLPFPNKKLVHKVYTQAYSEQEDMKPLDYPTMTKVWKKAPELQHIKTAKHKAGFSKCDVCINYKRRISKQTSFAKREQLDADYLVHVQEFMGEKYEYYAARAKAAAEPKKYMSIIIDAMDKRKTKVPFFKNPAKATSTAYSLQTKVIGAIVHGFGTLLFWCTDHLRHDTNLSIEVLRRVLLKYEQAKGSLPPVLYLQVDGGPDLKSKQFLAFIGYLVQMKIFNKVKVSFMIVGHTHEDIDQRWSTIGKYFVREKEEILSVPDFTQALKDSFKKDGSKPKCIEQILYCYNTLPLKDLCDDFLARFALPEKSGDNIHYFLFRRDSHGKCVMQYKLKRYSNAMWPRKYNPGQLYNHSENGVGTVIACDPFKDPVSKQKYWKNTVRFTRADGSHEEIIIKTNAAKQTITVFPSVASGIDTLPTKFTVADYIGTFQEIMTDQKHGVLSIIDKLDLSSTNPEAVHSWTEFWNTFPEGNKCPAELLDLFSLPKVQSHETHLLNKRKHQGAHIDDGNRPIGVVSYKKFKKADRLQAKRQYENLVQQTEELQSLKGGDIVVIVDSELHPNNPTYRFPFLVAEITDRNIGYLDTKLPDTEIMVQILRPTDLVTLTKKFLKWQGDDNSYWQPHIRRSAVKLIVELTPRGRKLAAHSLQDISNMFPDLK